jgi:hypothetical protein
MAKADKPLTQKDMLDRVHTKAAITRRALAILVDEKYIDQQRGPHNALLHRLITRMSVTTMSSSCAPPCSSQIVRDDRAKPSTRARPRPRPYGTRTNTRGAVVVR